ncbi:hypothetical protein VaNZ11_016886 [Volvox africanus]|uniref:Uncharacterized protein n=1 Tax=Volvox africanus TaxID=51714 RepID=A0ABQ5SPN6_9CHLO|nr:hypothetical protein VaNZ11_016886 [Volvox africanus]
MSRMREGGIPGVWLTVWRLRRANNTTALGIRSTVAAAADNVVRKALGGGGNGSGGACAHPLRRATGGGDSSATAFQALIRLMSRTMWLLRRLASQICPGRRKVFRDRTDAAVALGTVRLADLRLIGGCISTLLPVPLTATFAAAPGMVSIPGRVR